MEFLEVKNVRKVYSTRFGGNKVEALNSINFTLEKGEYVAIMGESGSGKTTLLNLLASLDKPTGGSIVLNGVDYSSLKDKQVAKFRREQLGFVFQDFNLLDTFSIGDNIALPLVLQGERHEKYKDKLSKLSGELGIGSILKKYPYEVSGGQKQRTAIARAMITDPEILLADEPTGALDSHSSLELLKMFDKINKNGQTILMVTHSIIAASYASRVLFIKDGKIFNQIYRGNMDNTAMYKRINDVLSLALSDSAEI